MKCEWCGAAGHEYTVHPEAVADVADWERQEYANRESDEWQLYLE